ncbi:MAG: outer membrane beta-barrel protein [Burkholderiaceae bacterium]|jgi:OOP family OmpA-OmpF porin
MQNSKKTLIAAAALTLFAALPGYAQERGLYVGAALGQSNVKWDEGGYAQRLVDSGYRSATTTSSRDGTAWRLYGGYRYGPHLAAEAGFTRFAKSGIDAVVGTGAGSSTGTVNGDTSIEAFELDGLALWPVGGGVDVYARLGFGLMRVKTTYGISGAARGIDSTDDTEAKLRYGLGAQYRWGKWALRADWIVYPGIGGDSYGAGGADANVALLGVSYRF